MSELAPIYRVIRRSTGSLQPGCTFWGVEVLYIGRDREEARLVYHRHEFEEEGAGYGNPAVRVEAQRIDPGEDLDDFDADLVAELGEG